jgi:hypothetical protein
VNGEIKIDANLVQIQYRNFSVKSQYACQRFNKTSAASKAFEHGLHR